MATGNFDPRPSLRLAFVTMFRNEASIIGPFLDQVSNLFDSGIFVDHESTDSSPDYLKRYIPEKFRMHSLKSAGYPQSEIATYYTRQIFGETDADWIFFLDCDEFLPFGTRAELLAAIASHDGSDALKLHWRNVVPVDLAGKDIFSGAFYENCELSKYYKVAVSRKLFNKDPNLQISQGYHHINTAVDCRVEELSPAGLLHIPIQSKLRFASKIKMSAEKLIEEQGLLSRGLGFHWVDYYNLIRQQGSHRFDFRTAALTYPEGLAEQPPEIRPLAFSFDYVSSPWVEQVDSVISDLFVKPGTPESASTYTLYDASGVLLSSQDVHRPTPSLDEGAPVPRDPGADIASLFGDTYSDLVEPLFSLPVKLPMTAWAGHIPFLFVLMRLLRPESYVDLGVHNGASLIAAATAAKAYQIPANLYGVDTWEGDAHAGLYEGEQIYQDLKQFVDRQFRGVHLVRRLFDDAVDLFAPGSIDLLHIDGLHTYEAVKHDYLTWLPKVSAGGVIMFHDTSVYERGFGVFRLFQELKDRFTTMEFFQSHGLGVLVLDPTAARVRPLVSLLRNPDAMTFYQSLVSDIASLLRGRMEHVEESRARADADATIARLREIASGATRRVGHLERDLAHARATTGALKLELEYSDAIKRQR